MKDVFAEQYEKKSLHRLNLSRSMEDGGMIPEALVPWTVAGIYMASTLGVDVIEYAPWAIFNMFGIIFSAILAIMGPRSEEHTSELQSRFELVWRLLLENKKIRVCLSYVC